MPFKVYIEFKDNRTPYNVICESYKVSRGCLVLKNPNTGYEDMDRNPDRIFYPLETLRKFSSVKESE